MAEGEYDHLLQPTAVGDLKKGSIALMSGHPCKVMDMSFSKTGKHGHAKYSVTGIDILTGKKYVESLPSHHTTHVVEVDKREMTVIYIDKDEKVVTLLDGDAEYKVPLEGETADAFLEAYEAENDDNVEWVLTILKAPDTSGGKVVLKEGISTFRKQAAS
jgi:translation initiation factor 5A